MGAFLALLEAVLADKPAIEFVQPPNPTKNICYLELEKIIGLYLFSLSTDLEEVMYLHLQLHQRSLIKDFIKSHFTDFKYRLLKFFIDQQ